MELRRRFKDAFLWKKLNIEKTSYLYLLSDSEGRVTMTLRGLA